MKKFAIKLSKEQREKISKELGEPVPELVILQANKKQVIQLQGHLADDSVPEAELTMI